MTEVPWAASMPQLLAPWLVRQRWYAAKGATVRGLERVGGFRLVHDVDGVGVEVHFIAVRAGDGDPVLYQVPLTYRSTRRPELEDALVGRFEHPVLGLRWIYDAPHDPVFVSALLDLLAGGRYTGGRAPGTGPGPGEEGAAIGVPQRPGPPPSGPAQVLRGEQSNTSIVVGRAGPDQVIVKLFRVLHPGTNPDVLVQTRLAAAGCDRVPHPVGWVEGTWLSPTGGLVRGHLAYACEFVPDAVDAWQVACAAVERGESFEEPAHELGMTTAEVHAALSAALPTRAVDAVVLQRLAEGLAGRVEWAVGLAPALEPFVAAARRAAATVRGLAGLPPLQHVHGDYHLGQVLRSPSRGWILLDFEGEPLRPLDERLEPDLPLRDVAGMLRSFDYAARHATIGLPTSHPAVAAADGWAQQARSAFLAGYLAGGGHAGAGPGGPTGAEAALLRVLEIDKAMYEVVYETLNRPDWIQIPLTALARLTAAAPAPADRTSAP
ncbi:MAG TPA: hypothetical protein VI248_28145 [Kineosporiaceae bacterium]